MLGENEGKEDLELRVIGNKIAITLIFPSIYRSRSLHFVERITSLTTTDNLQICLRVSISYNTLLHNTVINDDSG